MKVDIYNPNMRYYQPNFEAIRIKQIAPEFAPLKHVLETELDDFTLKGDNAQIVGRGLSATVYGFSKFKDIVFKKASNQKSDFASEIKNLKLLPDGLDTVQKFVAQAFDDKTGVFYLLSTRMKGKQADNITNPYTSEHFTSLFNTLFQLDKNGIYHGDFNPGNILLEDTGRVNLIDFQWMHKTELKRFFENKPNIVLPPFVLSDNSQMFEMASLPNYLKSVKNPKGFFTDYLKSKSYYHENRAQYLRELLPKWQYKDEKSDIVKSINYENAQSILLRYPDEDILKIESKKLQFLSYFREAFSRHDINNPEGNFITSPSAHLLTLVSLQDLIKELSKQMNQKYVYSAKKDYLSLTNEYAKYWFKSIKSWADGILDADIKRAVDIEHSRDIYKDLDKFNMMFNVNSIIDSKYTPKYTDTFDLAENTDKDEFLKGIKSAHSKLKRYTLMIFDGKIMRKQSEISKINDKIKNAYKNNWGLDVINLSILNIVKNRELKRLIVAKPNLKNRDEIITELHNSRLLYEDIARQNFKYIMREIISDSQEGGILRGYENMNNFE